MKELDLAKELHNELDSEYAKKLFRATSRNHVKAIAKYNRLRQLNDGAYFLIIFGTFERLITDRADAAVKRRTNKPSYYQRRAWETFISGTKVQANFLNRVRLLLDQRLPSFNKITNYYGVRNELAHEGLTAKVFNIQTVVADLKSALGQMDTSNYRRFPARQGCDEVWHGLMSGDRRGFALIGLMLIADFSVAAAVLAARAVMRAQFAPRARRSA